MLLISSTVTWKRVSVVAMARMTSGTIMALNIPSNLSSLIKGDNFADAFIKISSNTGTVI